MDEEQFEQQVKVEKMNYAYCAEITHMGLICRALGSTEIEAKEGLWEYLVDEIGL